MFDPLRQRPIWNDGPDLPNFLIPDSAPPFACRNICSGGGKGGTSTTNNVQSGNSTTTIPPEVLARYNAVNAEAETAAKTPFSTYGGEFVAPVNSAQSGGINSITGAAGSWDPSFNTAASTLNSGLGAAGQALGTGTNAGLTLAGTSLGATGQAVGQSSPYNTAAGSGYTGAYAGAQPYNTGATGLALAGTNAANPGAVDSSAIQQYLNPYESNVIGGTVAQLQNQFGQQRQALTGNQILSGSFGSDRGGVGQSVLANQQDLALGSTVSGLENQNYMQALAAAQQQQGVGLGAAQANRAALQQGAGQIAGIGSQQFGQGTTTAAGLLGTGNQIYNQGLGAANQYLSTGNQLFNQGNTAAGTYGNLGVSGANTYSGLGTANLQNTLSQGQASIGAGTVAQQTQQAYDTALYNQFLQQQAYPFQTTQFLAGIAEGTGALSGSSTTSSGTSSGTSTAPQPFFSDERLKENIHEVGRTNDGQAIIRFNYKGSPHTQLGMIAQDVLKKHPDAVGKNQGYLTVDYDAATRGAVNDNNEHRRSARASGGLVPMSGDMSSIVAAHQAMYPGAATGRDIGGGPRGLALAPSGGRGVIQGPKVDLPKTEFAKTPTPELQQILSGVNTGVNAGKNAADLVRGGADALVGSEAKGTVGQPGYTPATGGLVGSGGSFKGQGWIDRQLSPTSSPGAPAPASTPTAPTGQVPDASSPSGFAPAPSAAPAAAPSTTVASLDAPLIDDSGIGVAARGGRIRRAAGGLLPYDTGKGYMPDTDTPSIAVLTGVQKLMEHDPRLMGLLDQKHANGSNGSGGGGLGDLSKMFSMFGGSGGGGAGGAADAGGMSGGIVDAGGAGAGGISDGIGEGLAFLKRGGRVRRDAGGVAHDNQWMEIPGQVIGTGIGAYFGGPFGAVAGGQAGKNAGDTFGDLLGGNWNGVGQDMLSGVESGLTGPGGPLGKGGPMSGGMPGMPGMARGGRARFDEGGSVIEDVPRRDPFKTQAAEIGRGKGLAAIDSAREAINRATGLAPIAPPPVTGDEIAPDPAREVAADVKAEGLVPAPATTSTAPAPHPAVAPAMAAARPTPTAPAGPGKPGSWDDMLDRADRAVGAIESSSPDHSRGWDTVGPETRYKDGRVDRPYGRYGVMGANVPAWTKQYYGKALTPEEFKADPEAQKAVFRGQFSDYAKQFGSPQKAFGAWFAGPNGLNSNARDVVGTSVPWYMTRATAIYNGQPDPGARDPNAPSSNVASFNPQRQPAAPDAVPASAPAGLAPVDYDPMTGRVKSTGKEGFFDRGGWLDRNQREVTSGLTFLGNMLASPSRTLAGAVGSGVAAAAPAYLTSGFTEQGLGQRQQGLGQSQQQIDISNRSQLMSLWSNLLARAAGYTQQGQPVPPELNAQIDDLRSKIATAGNNLGGPGGGAKPVTPTQVQFTPPGGNGAASAPVASEALPPLPTTTTPATSIPDTTGTTSQAPSSKGTPSLDADGLPTVRTTDQGFLSHLDPNHNPVELAKRARETMAYDPNRASQLLEQSRQESAAITANGYGVGPGGEKVYAPGGIERKAAEARAPENQQLATQEAQGTKARQVQRSNLQHIAQALESFETGNLANTKAELQGVLKSIGINVGDTATMNATQFQTILKNAYSAMLAQAGASPQATNALREEINHTIPSNEFQPEANKKILAMLMGQMDWQDKHANDYTQAYQKNRYLDNNSWQQEWSGDKANNPQEFMDKHYQDLGVRGATPPLSEVKKNHVYVIEPEQAGAYNLPPGAITKPTKLRRVEKDGKLGWEKVR